MVLDGILQQSQGCLIVTICSSPSAKEEGVRFLLIFFGWGKISLMRVGFS